MNTATPETEFTAPTGEPVPSALKRFIWDIQSMVELADSEREILVIGRDLMARLVAADDWLPPAFARPDPTRGQRFQLYADALERFSVTVTVLAGGQVLPISQEPVWEIAGVLRGSVALAHFRVEEGGRPERTGEAVTLPPGKVETLSSRNRGATQFGNSLGDAVSVIIHVHGGELSQLAHLTFAPDGTGSETVVAYANTADAPPYDISTIQTRIAD